VKQGSIQIEIFFLGKAWSDRFCGERGAAMINYIFRRIGYMMVTLVIIKIDYQSSSCRRALYVNMRSTAAPARLEDDRDQIRTTRSAMAFGPAHVCAFCEMDHGFRPAILAKSFQYRLPVKFDL
jgi:hypothetical protein